MLPPGFTLARGRARPVATWRGYPWPVFSDGQADLPDGGRRLDPRHQLGVAVDRRRRHVRDPLPPGRQHRERVSHPRRHQRQLRRRRHAVGHLALVRGARRRPRVGVRPGRQADRPAAPRARRLQPRGRRGRAGRAAGLPDRGPAGRRLLSLHAGRRTRTSSEGLLEVAVVAADGSVSWREVPDPTPHPGADADARQQVPEMTPASTAARGSGTTAASSTSPPRATSASGPTTRGRAARGDLRPRRRAGRLARRCRQRHRLGGGRDLRLRGRRQHGDRR